MLTKNINLLLYPFIQITSLICGLYIVNTNIALAIGLILLGSVFMSFALHISYHYKVHHSPKNKRLNRVIELLITLLLGLPFHFYKLQHFNHHKHNNDLKDLSSTYKMKNGKMIAKPFLKYVLLWFLPNKSINELKKDGIKHHYFTSFDHTKMGVEGFLNIAVLIVFIFIGWEYFLLYYLMIYLGWCFIAMHNYGQHLPYNDHNPLGYSYYNKLYNALFMNNGLHYEHHKNPSTNFWELIEERDTKRTNKWSHVFEGIRFNLTNNKN